MNYFRRLLKGNSEKNISIDDLAKSVLKLMAEKAHPFDTWRDPEADFGEDMEKLFNFYCWIYQLYTFTILVYEKYGSEIADIVVGRLENFEQEILGTSIFNATPSLRTCFR